MEGDETNIPERKGQETREAEGFSAFGQAMSIPVWWGMPPMFPERNCRPCHNLQKESSWPISGVLAD
jgi:hypothetical protein